MQERLEETLEREGLHAPSLWRRIGAYFIDDSLVSLLVVAIYWNRIVANAADAEALIEIINSAFLQIVAIRFFYQWIFTAHYGASLGKMFFKMRVLSTATLDNPTWGAAALRSALRAMGEILFYIPFLTALADRFSQTLHDKLAKTIVINIA